MKSNIEKVSGLQRKLNVEIPGAVVDSTFNRYFQDVQKEVTIKGFRKGKAPLAQIKSMYGERIKQDVAQELIQSHYLKALTEHKVEPIGYPEFEFEDPKEAKDFSFTAVFDIRPDVQVKKIEGLEVKREKMIVDDSKVNQVLENIRASRSTTVDVLEDRPAQMGDVAIIDFDGTIDGVPLEGGMGRDHQLELGSKQFIEGFEEGIVGMKIGGNTTLNLKFPEKYHVGTLAGKSVAFAVSLKGLKKKVLPELNEEFLKTMGGPGNLEELTKVIREDLENTEKKRIDDAFKNRLLKALVAANPVEVPQSLLKEQKQSLVEDFRKRMTEQGLTEQDFHAYVEKWDGDFAKTANEMIQSSFLVDTLARDKDLICKKEDVDQKFAEYSNQTGIEEARIREFYSKPDQMSRLTYMITEEKVIKFLTEKAKIKEVAATELKDEE